MRRRWKLGREEILALVGTLTDRQVADRAGCALGTVYNLRTAAGVPASQAHDPDGLRERILGALDREAAIACAELAERLAPEVSGRTLRRAIRDLETAGMVQRVGAGRSTRWRVH